LPEQKNNCLTCFFLLKKNRGQKKYGSKSAQDIASKQSNLML
jgi:hypothetical protein